ncbi:MAG: DUF202 domain-containing protein [Candidatus Aenigmarchaeota archaeon]|nr:DUF202 domain-containing protein [Candidatus Aenigmarchaeota archaeon]
MKKKKGILEGPVASFALAEEQTLLAKQRTMMSSMRTGLAFVGVGLVVAKFWIGFFYQLISAILIIIGFVEIYGAKRKMMKYDRRLHNLRKAIHEKDTDKIKREWFE